MTAVLVAGYKGYPTDRMYVPIAGFPTDISDRDGYHNTEGSYSPGMFNRIFFINFLFKGFYVKNKKCTESSCTSVKSVLIMI